MGDSSKSEIIGIGNIRLRISLGSTLLLKDVRYIPDVRMNLMSRGPMDREWFTSSIANGVRKLTKGSLVVMEAVRCCSLCRTQAALYTENVDVVLSTECKECGKSSYKCIVKRDALASAGTSTDTGVRKVAEISPKIKHVNIAESVDHDLYGVPNVHRSITKGASCAYANNWESVGLLLKRGWSPFLWLI